MKRRAEIGDIDKSIMLTEALLPLKSSCFVFWPLNKMIIWHERIPGFNSTDLHFCKFLKCAERLCLGCLEIFLHFSLHMAVLWLLCSSAGCVSVCECVWSCLWNKEVCFHTVELGLCACPGRPSAHNHHLTPPSVPTEAINALHVSQNNTVWFWAKVIDLAQLCYWKQIHI